MARESGIDWHLPDGAMPFGVLGIGDSFWALDEEGRPWTGGRVKFPVATGLKLKPFTKSVEFAEGEDGPAYNAIGTMQLFGSRHVFRHLFGYWELVFPLRASHEERMAEMARLEGLEPVAEALDEKAPASKVAEAPAAAIAGSRLAWAAESERTKGEQDDQVENNEDGKRAHGKVNLGLFIEALNDLERGAHSIADIRQKIEALHADIAAYPSEIRRVGATAERQGYVVFNTDGSYTLTDEGWTEANG